MSTLNMRMFVKYENVIKRLSILIHFYTPNVGYTVILIKIIFQKGNHPIQMLISINLECDLNF